MGVTYTEPGEIDLFGDWEGTRKREEAGAYMHPGGSPERMITVEEPRDSTLGKALTALIGTSLDRGPYLPRGARLLVTTEGWWSGYSEYTVTDTWETVVVTCPELNWERRWDTPALLFRDLATVAP